jgi:hypothetical protein
MMLLLLGERRRRRQPAPHGRGLAGICKQAILTLSRGLLVPQVEGPDQAMKIAGMQAQQLRGLDVVAIRLRQRL